MTFTDKTILITGAARGIGRTVAEKLYAEGANLILGDLPGGDGEQTAFEIDPEGKRVIFMVCDVTKKEHVEGIVKVGISTFGKLDGAVNNAGIGGHREALVNYSEDNWDRVLDINLTGVFRCMKAELPNMLQNRGGSIVNISSMAGLRPFPMHSAYAASKHGVIGLTSSAAYEYASKGIRVNAICPAFTQTAMVDELKSYGGPEMGERLARAIPMRRLGTTDEIAEAILWLLSDASSFVTGVALPVSGGL